MEFSKIDRKILFLIALALAAAVIGILFGLKFLAFSAKEARVENTAGGANTENPENQTPVPDVQVQIEPKDGQQSSGGGLLICADKCGDGVCQPADQNCPEGSMNCSCPETKEDCPQDCK